jgi:hypothetical protein
MPRFICQCGNPACEEGCNLKGDASLADYTPMGNGVVSQMGPRYIGVWNRISAVENKIWLDEDGNYWGDDENVGNSDDEEAGGQDAYNELDADEEEDVVYDEVDCSSEEIEPPKETN